MRDGCLAAGSVKNPGEAVPAMLQDSSKSGTTDIGQAIV